MNPQSGQSPQIAKPIQPSQILVVYAPSNQQPASSHQLVSPPQPHPVFIKPRPKPSVMLFKQDVYQGSSSCTRCRKITGTICRKVQGCAFTSWMVGLCCLAGILCMWVPCLVEGCYDRQFLCTNCNLVKREIKSEYCC